MKRIYQGWVFAGLAALGQPGANVAYGQASAQSNAPVVAPTPQSVGPAQGYGGSPSTYPKGSTPAYPRASQQSSAIPKPSPQYMIPKPSPQYMLPNYGSVANRIPHPRSAESFRPSPQSPAGAAPMASPQAGPPGYGYGSYMRPGSSLSGQIGAGGTGVAASPYSGMMGGMSGAGAPSTGMGGTGAAGGPGTGTPSGTGATPDTGTGAGTGTGTGAGTTPGTGTGAGAGTTPDTGTGAGTGTGTGAEAAINESVLAGLGGNAGAGPQASLTPNMIGDLSPLYSQPAAAGGHSPIKPPPPRGAALAYPTVRNFKASENQSPLPQDRVFFDFNYYNNVNSAINTADRTQVDHMKAYTYTWGFEKTFDQGNGSIGMRLPLNSLSASSINNAFSTPTSTALGNLDIFAKYILKKNTETGSLISAGFQITPPTATSRFAGAPYVASLNTTYFQPFIAYLWKRDRLYVQGFSGFDFPSNNADVTLMYNDIAIGYFLYRDTDTRNFLTSVAPTFEVHLDSPLNHRSPFNTYDLAASPFVCNLTYGVNFLFTGRAMLTAALVTPVTSPKPFDTECALLFNVFFGRTVRSELPITPPVIQ